MRRLDVDRVHGPGDATRIGTLAEHERRLYFEYDPDFVDAGVELSPFRLPLQRGLVEHTAREFGPLPGLFADSLPDGWGLLLMDRHFRQRGIDPAPVSPLDRLAYLGTRTMGALTYHPNEDTPPDTASLDLYALGVHASEVLAGDEATVLPELLRAGGSPGGARPKVLVGVCGSDLISGEDELPERFEHWLVKFFAQGAAPDTGALEFAYAEMARAAGLDLPESRLFIAGGAAEEVQYFGVKRFDRESGNRRVHVHTFANLIQTDFRVPSSDYLDLVKVARGLTRSHQDVLRLFRLMVFNIAAHNRDDHAKNFSFLLDSTGTWRLAPAYDLTFAPGPGGEHSTTVAGEGRAPTRDHCAMVAKEAGISSRELDAAIDAVNGAISDWVRFAAEAGCTKKTQQAVSARHRTL